jgi:hypothetical protein
MRIRVLRPAIAVSTVMAVLVAALAVYAYLNTGTTHADSTYAPTTTAKMCNAMSAGFPDPDIAGNPACAEAAGLALGPAAKPNYTTTLSYPSGDLNFSSVVTMAPAGEVITAGNVGAAFPVGTKVGGLHSDAELGILNSTCSNLTPVDFVFYNVALPNNTGDPRSTTGPGLHGSSTNIAFPLIEGTTDRFSVWRVGANASGALFNANLTAPFSTTVMTDSGATFGVANALVGDIIYIMNGTGQGQSGTISASTNTSVTVPAFATTPDGTSNYNIYAPADIPINPPGGTVPGPQALSTELAIQNYPSYLLDLFDPDFVPGVSDGAAKPIVPVAVYGSLSHIVGTWIPLYFAQFAASGVNSLGLMPAPLGLINSAEGQPSVSVLNDPTAVAASVSSITSFCTPNLVTTTLLGVSPDGKVRASNPTSAGTGFFIQNNASLRDLDQDTYENTLDTCPAIADAVHDPRNPARPGDADADGVGDACDATAGASFDEDGDGFQNAQDNCPQVANPDQKESSRASAQADNGPRTDGIGDACQGGGTLISPSSATFTQNGVSVTVALAAGADPVAHGRYMVTTNVIAKCFGGTDADGDGYCSTQDTPGDSGSCTGTVPPSCTVRHNAWGPGLGSTAMDNDADGFSNAMETYLGTDPTKSCAQTPVPPGHIGGVSDETIANWPFDFNNDRLAGLGDVSTYSSRFGKPVNAVPAPGYNRWDLNGNGIIDLADVSKFSSVFGKRCGESVGAPGPWVQQ